MGNCSSNSALPTLGHSRFGGLRREGSMIEKNDEKKELPSLLNELKLNEKDRNSEFFDKNVGDKIYAVGCSLKGKSFHPNEDRMIICNELEKVFMENKGLMSSSPPSVLSRTRLFAVIDGHGGSACAEYLRTNLPAVIAKSKWWSKISANETNNVDCICNALEGALFHLEQDFHKVCRKTNDTSGAVIVVAVELDGYLCVSNIGDSEALLLDHRSNKIKMTTLHSVDDPKEKRRVKKAGANITNDHIFGILAPSRTLGDFDVKDVTRNVILSNPMTHVVHLKHMLEGDHGNPVLVIACDGFWDIGKDQAIQFISDQAKIWQKCQSGEKCEDSMTASTDPAQAIARFAQERGSTDDITVIFVQF